LSLVAHENVRVKIDKRHSPQRKGNRRKAG
jgi:hypothetical protein